MQPMWFYIVLCKSFDNTYENPQCPKGKEMQPMWLCNLTWRRFKETFENTQWRKTKQVQPLWLCILSCRGFEKTFDNAQWKNLSKSVCQPLPHSILICKLYQKLLKMTKQCKKNKKMPLSYQSFKNFLKVAIRWQKLPKYKNNCQWLSW